MPVETLTCQYCGDELVLGSGVGFHSVAREPGTITTTGRLKVDRTGLTDGECRNEAGVITLHHPAEWLDG